jgi:uncharacterized damage-inducible protein DinB
MSSSKEAERLAVFSSAVRQSTLKRLRLVTEGFENYRPAPGALSFAEQALHLIDSDNYLFDRLEGNDGRLSANYPSSFEVKERAQFTALIEALERNGTQRSLVLESLTEADLDRTLTDARFEGESSVWWIVVRGNLDHEIHHRGQIAACLRMAGLLPDPSE